MSDDSEFELPDHFIRTAHYLEVSAKTLPAEVKLSTECDVLIHKIAEQTGLPERAVTSALVSEGLTDFIHKGILF